MNQNPEQPRQNDYSQYPPYEPTQAATPYDPQAAPPAYPGPGYQPPQTPGSGASQYPVQSPYGDQSPYSTPNAYPQAGGQPNSSGMYPPPVNPYAPNNVPQFPGPGYPPPTPKKSKTWLWITLGVVGVLLVALIVSCSVFANGVFNIAKTIATPTSVYNNQNTDSTPTVGSTPTADTSNSTGTTNTETSNTNNAKIGDTLAMQGVDCTMTLAKHIDGDTYSQPKAGKEFVLVHVKIVDKSNPKGHYNPLDFHLISSNGARVTHSYLVPSAYSDQLSFGDMKVGSTAEGDLIFEAPVGDHGLKLDWTPVSNDFTDNPGVAQWNLGL
ncbi:hypothetical protein KDA_60870 [Dictyobacter alpinus]|uniref:DUF4352 domain-containing protein n=1 Tax=Dictyobacter alpinus TaxID=2014873 RepID=A0A402BGV4_9CHLR|nr:DUF4352 domain-containing protein [Dictyobacter alpinus]GCE30603.1 hypothetical protein KDA_60870 [Dictyobacter alpinus]